MKFRDKPAQHGGDISIEGMTPEEYYHYSLERAPSRHVATVVDRIAGKGEGCCVLDVGCGAGLTLIHSWKQISSAKMHGCDIDEKMLEYARIEADKAGAKINFRKSEPKSLPYGDRQFDLVFSEGAMHHFTYAELMLEEMWRVLAPGGTLLIMDINPDSLYARGYAAFTRLKGIFGWSSKGELALAESIEHSMSQHEVVRLMANAGIDCHTSGSLAAMYYESEKDS